ncbi:MAG: formylmethanofuran dehydrogenase [Candidatus Omnitrophica bacterium]|nr:formylmethanofuran dehydrogenase [Candidatus Omnitrophota bacterium]
MKEQKYEDLIAFHGHACPGLAIGYRVAKAALRELSARRSEDEEFVAIVENNACGIDAIQLLCGCTAGKGNLIFRDNGKHVYTFFNRKTKKGVRIYADTFYMNDDLDKRFVELSRKRNLTAADKKELADIREKRIKSVLEFPEEDLLKISSPKREYPERARIFNSVICEECGERVMETRIKRKDGRSLCNECCGFS